MGFEHIKVVSGLVTKVILARPDVRNAMDAQSLRELTAAFGAIARDDGVRAVVVTGEGKDFCAGADINWMKKSGQFPPEEGKKDARLLAQMLQTVDVCPVPVIVAACGHVFGGGLGLVAACDIAILSDDAKMSFSECRLGIMPAVISCWVLPKIGAVNVRRYYLTGEVFGAGAAVKMGLAHETMPAAELPAKVDGVVANILTCGPLAVRTAKALIYKLTDMTLPKRIDLTVETLVRLRSGPEGQEGLAAFLEKRPPSWASRP